METLKMIIITPLDALIAFIVAFVIGYFTGRNRNKK